jgi:arginase
VREGVSFRDSLTALALLAGSGLITSAEFVELNPILDKEGRTVTAAVRLIARLLESGAGSISAIPVEAVSAEALR